MANFSVSVQRPTVVMGLCFVFQQGVEMIIAVTGWRRWKDAEFIENELERYVFPGVIVRLGDMSGADAIVWEWCRKQGVEYRRYRADWHQYGKAAGPIRNRTMLTREWFTADPSGLGEQAFRERKANMLLAFPEPEVMPRAGSGSWDCIGAAVSLGISLVVPGYPASRLSERKENES
jgi:SLOG family YspA-like protein